MPQRESELPEGTDRIINGAMETGTGAGGSATGSNRGIIGGTATGDDTGGTTMEESGEASPFRKGVESLKQQATGRARIYADEGKVRASEALDELSRIVEEAAGQVDDRLGEQYGGYARKAAQAVSGLATNLREREIEDLYEDARDYVRRSPAVAIGIAAAVGFALIRVVKAGLPDEEADAPPAAGRSRGKTSKGKKRSGADA